MHLLYPSLSPANPSPQDRLLAGTDAGPFDVEFGQIDYCLQLMVQAGLTPLEAIRASTSLPARACGVSDFTGTLGRGQHRRGEWHAAADIRCISHAHWQVVGRTLPAHTRKRVRVNPSSSAGTTRPTSITLSTGTFARFAASRLPWRSFGRKIGPWRCRPEKTRRAAV